MDYTLYKCKKQILCLKLQINGEKKNHFYTAFRFEELLNYMHVCAHVYSRAFCQILYTVFFFVVLLFFYFDCENIFLFFNIFVCHVVPVLMSCSCIVC